MSRNRIAEVELYMYQFIRQGTIVFHSGFLFFHLLFAFFLVYTFMNSKKHAHDLS